MPIFQKTDFEYSTASTRKDVRDLLKFDLKPYRISAWNQGGRPDVGTGVCMGMCMDWVRRILTGLSRSDLAAKKSALQPTGMFVTKRTELRWEEQKNTHKLIRKTQNLAVATQLERNFIRDHREALCRLHTDLDPSGVFPFTSIDGLIEAVDKVAKKYNLDPFDARKRLSDAVADYIKKEFLPYLKNSVTVENCLRIKKEAHADIFAEFAKYADAKIKTGLVRETTRRHCFSRLQAVGEPVSLVKDPKVTEEDFLGFIDTSLEITSPGECAILSLGQVHKGGHDVAWYVGERRSFISYFDPNLGEFYFAITKVAELALLLSASWRALYNSKEYRWLSWARYAER